jgi:tetratricopeptide (TPR) repeat protein
MRFRFAPFLAGAAVTAACLFAPSALAQESDALVAKGKACLEKRDWNGAKDAFLAAAGKDPKSVEARRGAAEALLALGKSDDAVDYAFAGLGLVGDADGPLWLLAARAYLHKADTLPPDQTDEIKNAYADAKAKAALALKHAPDLLYARVILARACRQSGEVDRAIEVMTEALAKAPEDFECNFEMGMCRAKKGEHTLAVASFEAASAADPTSAAAHFYRGLALAFLKSTEDAAAAFAKSSLLDPTNIKTLQYLGKYGGKFVIPQLRGVVKTKPDHTFAHSYLAYYLAYAKDEAGAMTESKAAMALAPEDAWVTGWHGLVLEALGKKEEALKYWRKAMEKDPKSEPAYGKLVEYATNPGNGVSMEDRKPVIDFLGKKRPDEGVFWNNVGLLYRDVGKDFRRSLDAYLKAAKLSPEDQGIQNDTGLIYLYHGPSIGIDPALGLPYFERSLALVEDEGQAPEMGYRDTLENLAWFYMTVDKNPEKALHFATKRNDPDFIRSLSKDLAAPSGKATQVRAWAEGELKRK